MDTKSTVPDIALEVHLFVRKLVQPGHGDRDFNDREKLHVEIKEWIEKITSWGHHTSDLNHEFGALSTHIQEVMTLMQNEGVLGDKLQKAESVEAQHRESFNLGYQKMVEKQQAKFQAKEISEENLKKNLETLQGWRIRRQEMNQVDANNLRKEIRDLGLKMPNALDALIDEAQKHTDDFNYACMQVTPQDQNPGSPKDAIMEELEGILDKGSLQDMEMRKILTQRTLVLGEQDDTPEPLLPDAQPASLSPSKSASQQVLQVPAAQPSPPSQLEKDDEGVMKTPTPEDNALKHIALMEDGPVKSSLLALCEASVSKAPILSKEIQTDLLAVISLPFQFIVIMIQ